MEELWGKLTNLSYELFGVFIPGAILLLFLSLWWFALGDAPFLAQHSLVASSVFFQSIPESFFLSAVLVSVIYFLGHLLVWVSRKTAKHQERMLMRVIRSLHFRIPEAPSKFDTELAPMMEASARHLGISIDDSTWRRFYPLAKIILAEKLNKSLVSIYQNKYTLHRSITASAAILFWLSFGSILIGAVFCFPSHVHWGGMSALLLGSVILVWGFSASAAYYWRMWGNVIITETYAVLSGATK